MSRSSAARNRRQRQGNILLTVVLALALVAMLSGAVLFTTLVVNPFAPKTVAVPTPTATATLIPTATPFVPQKPAPAVTALAAVMIDPATGDVLFNLHPNDQRAMASTTKIMTAVVALLTAPNLIQTVTVGSDVNQLIGTGASEMGVLPGQKYTLQQLLYGLLLPSGDDAAIVIADAVAGSQPAFVARMNDVATWLGLSHTHYANPHGLDAAGHYTSAADLAQLTAFALEFPLFRQIVATPTYVIPATATHPLLKLESTNQFLNTADSLPGTSFVADGKALGVDGVKTGFTANAGHCLVLDASQNGHEVILVLLGESNDPARFVDGDALLHWIFSQYGG